MPTSVIAAVASSYIAQAVTAEAFLVGFAAESSFIIGAADVIGAAAGFVASSAIRSAFAPDPPQLQAPSITAAQTERSHVLRSPIAARNTIYGRVLTSGPLVFAASTADHNTLHMVVALAGHEVEAIDEVYFGDDVVGTLDGAGNVTTGAFAGVASIRKYLGTTTQTADPTLVAAGLGWTADHRLRGIAYLAITLTFNRDVYPRGIPNIRAVVRGKKLYDPRTGLTVYSTNPALMIRDYVAGAHGLAAGATEIDDASFIAAANLSDEPVTLAAGGTEARYTANGICGGALAPRAALEQMISAGLFSLVWSGGVYRLIGGAYVAPTVTLTADDLRGPVNVRARVPRQELYNAVRGTYIDPLKNWQPGDFPPVRNSTYAADDGGEIFRDIELAYTTSSATAQRLAKIILERGRQGIAVTFPCNLRGLKIAVGDTVRLTLDHLGWSAKEFLVVGWRLDETGGVDLTLHEESAAAYAWSAEETLIDAAPDTNLPDPFVVAAPGVPDVTESLFETTGSAGVKARASMTWAASTDAFVVDYLPEYRVAGGAWVALPPVSGLQTDIFDIAPGSYEFRLRARNALGVRSAYSGTRAREILGLTAPPANVTGFYVAKSGGFGLAQWVLHPDLDVRIGGRIVIRHSPLTSGAAWENGIIVEEFTGDTASGLLPLMTGTYMAKAIDSSGNYSTAAISFVATEGMVTGWVTVGSSVQHSGFAGTKANVATVSGAIQLDSATAIDDMATNIDDWPYLDALGGISATGSYTFDAVLDLTTSATRRFEADIRATSFDASDLIDARTDLIDTWDEIDGAAINDCDVTLYISTTDDDPAGSPVWSGWQPFFVGDFTARAARFRLDFAAGSSTHNIAVDQLRVDAKIPA